MNKANGKIIDFVGNALPETPTKGVGLYRYSITHMQAISVRLGRLSLKDFGGRTGDIDVYLTSYTTPVIKLC